MSRCVHCDMIVPFKRATCARCFTIEAGCVMLGFVLVYVIALLF